MRSRLVLALCAAALFAVGAGVPVSAQRYPPADIGGTNSSGSGPTGSNTANNGGSASEFFNPGAGGGGAGSSGSGSGSNTSDAGPFCDLAHCLRYGGEVDGRLVAARAEERGDLTVAAVEGCCESHSRIDVFIESERRFLGTVYASEDGSYLGVFTLPASIKPGLHHVVAEIEGCGEFRGALQVLAKGTGAGAGDGTSVLGTSLRNDATGSGGGILPRTGGELFRLMMWALILIGVGTLIVVATRRLGERLSPVRTLRRRPRARRSIAALPPPEVPFVDTSRFVPYRSGAERRTLTRSSARTRTGVGSSERNRAPKSGSPS